MSLLEAARAALAPGNNNNGRIEIDADTLRALIAEHEHITGLATERLDLYIELQKKFVADTDALFLARKQAERERDEARAALEAAKAAS